MEQDGITFENRARVDTHALNKTENRRSLAVAVLWIIELHDTVCCNVYFRPLLRRLVWCLLQLETGAPTADGLSMECCLGDTVRHHPSDAHGARSDQRYYATPHG